MSIEDEYTIDQLSELTGFNIMPGTHPKCGWYQTRLRGLILQIELHQYKVRMEGLLANAPELYEDMSAFLLENNFNIQDDNARARLTIIRENDLIAGFKRLLNLINGAPIDGLVDRRRAVYIDQVALEHNKNYSAAFTYKTLIDNGIGHLIPGNHRRILHADDQENNILKGTSNPNPNNPHKEHVVPCIAISHRIVEMIEGNPDITIDALADFINQNLAIVIIEAEQAHRLDNEHGLKERMPDGWIWGDNIYALDFPYFTRHFLASKNNLLQT